MELPHGDLTPITRAKAQAPEAQQGALPQHRGECPLRRRRHSLAEHRENLIGDGEPFFDVAAQQSLLGGDPKALESGPLVGTGGSIDQHVGSFESATSVGERITELDLEPARDLGLVATEPERLVKEPGRAIERERALCAKRRFLGGTRCTLRLTRSFEMPHQDAGFRTAGLERGSELTVVTLALRCTEPSNHGLAHAIVIGLEPIGATWATQLRRLEQMRPALAIAIEPRGRHRDRARDRFANHGDDLEERSRWRLQARDARGEHLVEEQTGRRAARLLGVAHELAHEQRVALRLACERRNIDTLRAILAGEVAGQ